MAGRITFACVPTAQTEQACDVTVAAALFAWARPRDQRVPSFVTVLDAEEGRLSRAALSLVPTLLRLSFVVRGLRAADPMHAEVALCRALRERTSAYWLVLNAHALVLVARARRAFPVPDVVRLVRHQQVAMLALGDDRSQRHPVPRDARLSAWAQKSGFSPVFCG